MLSGRLLGYSGALVTALLSAALVDEGAEWLSNAGVLGGSATDMHQEMALPVALAAFALLVVLAGTIALRARSADRIAFDAMSSSERGAVRAQRSQCSRHRAGALAPGGFHDRGFGRATSTKRKEGGEMASRNLPEARPP